MSFYWKLSLLAFALVTVCARAGESGAESATSVDWSMLPDPGAQVFDDPYRDLSRDQMASLMQLVRYRHELASEQGGAGERELLLEKIKREEAYFTGQGLDPNWILSQRELVASRRERAALATNQGIEGATVELTGYFLHTTSLDTGERVAYLVPNRGVCMHLPAPPPNQVIQLNVTQGPEPSGPCIAALVRGRLFIAESRHTIPSADGTTVMWNRWSMKLTDIRTKGP